MILGWVIISVMLESRND